MPKFMDLELANACYKLMHDLIQVKKGEYRRCNGTGNRL